MLLALKQYPQLTLKEAFYRWFIKTTPYGEQIILTAAHNLVLYTNINKFSAFYRLLNAVRVPRKFIHPRTKRLTTMIYVFTKLYFDRSKKDAFDILLLKTKGKSKEYMSM